MVRVVIGVGREDEIVAAARDRHVERIDPGGERHAVGVAGEQIRHAFADDIMARSRAELR